MLNEMKTIQIELHFAGKNYQLWESIAKMKIDEYLKKRQHVKGAAIAVNVKLQKTGISWMPNNSRKLLVRFVIKFDQFFLT